jgi:CubicO group peptidase (beta-lactamase class C family)
MGMFNVTDVASNPAELGIEPAKLQDLFDRAAREIDEGHLPSCQLAVARDGRLAAFRTLGRATDSTRYVIFSATKAIVASAVWLLIADGRIDPTDKVAEHIPEFASNGKDRVTIEQVMLHTAGFPHAPMPPSLWHDREGRLRRFSEWRLNWQPGTAFEYHATSAHWVLAELITRASDLDHRRFIAERVADPLGLPKLQLGVPEADQSEIANLEVVGEPATEDEMEATIGLRVLPPSEVTEGALLNFNEPAARSAGVPGGGAVASAADVALFYQGLLHNPGSLWEPLLLANVKTQVRNTFIDPMVGVPANRSLGLVLAGDDGKSHMRHNFGRTVSPGAFGHAGAGGQIAWADPATGLSFCYLTNGLDAHVLREGRRGVALSSRAAVLSADS